MKKRRYVATLTFLISMGLPIGYVGTSMYNDQVEKQMAQADREKYGNMYELMMHMNGKVITLDKFKEPITVTLANSFSEKEKEQILKYIKPKDYIITLEIEGKELSSIELADKLDKTLIASSDITFIIGGSYGIHHDIKEKSNYKLSFSKMTFPHQLFRILLLEQLFRSYKILNNEKYHK